jgi:hypothetical protein
MNLKTLQKAIRKVKGFLFDPHHSPEHKARIARHPERFNLDGTPRMIAMYDSSKFGPIKGTNPEGAPEAKDSRQVRRRKIRVFLFNQITANASFGIARREVRRYWARKGRLQPPQPAQ